MLSAGLPTPQHSATLRRISNGTFLFVGMALLSWHGTLAEDAPELQVMVPPNLTSGTIVETSVRLTTKVANVLGWQLSVTHEGLQILGTSTAGTDFDRLSRGGFVESGVHPDGTSYFSTGVLSFAETVTLPSGTTEVLKVRCLIARKDPGKVRIIPTNGLKLPNDDREFSNQAVLVGGQTKPVFTAEKSFVVVGCAAFLLRLNRGDGQDPTAPIEVRRDTVLELEVSVNVESNLHLSPSGFSFGVAQDASLLSLSSAKILEDFAQAFVKADGFARIESSDTGFAAVVLSSTKDPSTLGPGTTAVAKATYGFKGNGASGDRLPASFALNDQIPIGRVPVPALFQPGDALPCEYTKLDVELQIGLDGWVRGDSNSDNVADLTDAIVTLRHLFQGGVVECARAMEVNLDGKVDLTDPVSLLVHLFRGGPAPPPPFPGCGTAEDTMECDKFACPAV